MEKRDATAEETLRQRLWPFHFVWFVLEGATGVCVENCCTIIPLYSTAAVLFNLRIRVGKIKNAARKTRFAYVVVIM